jgi:predicted HicB family RNase H-like nuclease
MAMAPQAKVGDQPVNVRLPRELHEAVLDRARVEDRTLAQTVRVALRYYLQETSPVAGA